MWAFSSLFFISHPIAQVNLLGSPKVDLQVRVVHGDCFLQPKNSAEGKAFTLGNGFKIVNRLPFALVSRIDSYLEIYNFPQRSNILRIGQSSAVEIRNHYHLYFFQGSALFSKRNTAKWKFETDATQIDVIGNGTWMVETTVKKGFKIILLEGELQITNAKKSISLNSGELLLVGEKEGQISQKIQIDLPLLFKTCRLLNNFESELPSKSRIISAAQVQALRLKKRYEAVVGGVKDNKLQIWAIKKKKSK